MTKKHRSKGIILAAGLILMLLTGNVLLKNIFARERPFIQNPEAILSIPAPFGYSFPSSHSFSSFTAAAVLSRFGRKWAAFAIPSAVMIAFSRLYFYVHFPTDVLAGMVMGIVLGTLVYQILRKKLLSGSDIPDQLQNGYGNAP